MSDTLQENPKRNEQIGAALKKLQAKPMVAKAKAEGQAGSGRYKYATLEECWKACREQLNEAGLVVIQRAAYNQEAGWFTMVTELQHPQTGWASKSEMPILKAEDMQKLGSAITYARRYGLVTACGIIVEDDDGAAASGNASETQPTSASRSYATQGGSPPATQKQQKYIHTLLSKKVHDYGDDFHTTGMTMAQAKKMIDDLLAKPDKEQPSEAEASQV